MKGASPAARSDRVASLRAWWAALGERVGRVWAAGRDVLARQRASTAGRLLQRLGAVALIGLSVWYLAPHVMSGLRSLSWQTIRAGAGYLIGAIVLTTASIFLGAPVLRTVLAALGHSLPPSRAQVIQTTSNLAGYIPGFGWRYLSKGYLLAREGVPGKTLALSMSIEFAAIIGTAGVLVALLLPGEAAFALVGAAHTGVRAALVVTTLLGLGLTPLFARRMAQARLGAGGVRLLPEYLWLAALLALAAWVLFGLGFACTVRALGVLPPDGWRVAIAALAASFIVSLLAVFVPGGLGVREGVMTAVLATVFPPHTAALAALFSRVVMLVSELLAWSAVRLWIYAFRRRIAARGLPQQAARPRSRPGGARPER